MSSLSPCNRIRIPESGKFFLLETRILGFGIRDPNNDSACKESLVDFAIGLVISVLNLPDGQVLFFGEIQITEGL